MLKKTVAYLIILFWVLMAALFARREIIPRLYATPTRGYTAVRAYAQSHAGHRMGIYAPDGSRIGSTETTYDLKADGTCEIGSTVTVSIEKHPLFLLGAREHAKGRKLAVELYSKVIIGPDDTLDSFGITVNCDALSSFAFARGKVQGNSLRLIIDVAGNRTEKLIPVTRDDVVSTGFMSVGTLPNLRVGQTWYFKILDPITFRFSTATANVKKKTEILLGRRERRSYTVYEVELSHNQAVARAWVTESGEVLKEESFGFVLIREPLPHEIPGGEVDIQPATEPTQN